MSDHNFNTPPELIEKISLLDDNGIGLDPCSNDNSMVGARFSFDKASNGLNKSWRGHGLVFMNPPHSMSPNNIEPWVEKAWTEFMMPSALDEALDDDQFVALIPAKPDTAWFHDHIAPMPMKCFLRGRPKFWLNGEPTPGPGKFASMLVYAGTRPGRFMDVFDGMGWFA